VGCDFSSSPTRRKPIVLAHGERHGDVVRLSRIESFPTLAAFGHWLAQPGRWVGGFDFPFGLPRELVEHLRWPLQWHGCMAHYAGLTRADIRDTFAAFCAARPVGGKFAHRAFDRLAGSSPSMKWVNPPVAYMMHAGVPLLLAAGVDLPGLHAGDPARVALEAYPGLLARELLQRRSYKSDDAAKHTPERLIARKDLLGGLELGATRLGLRLKLTHAQRDALVEDASGDRLDAVLCLVQAAWADRLGPPAWGLPAGLDPLEGWIVSA
jgi:DNA-directed RNA polymerase subunit H (RpoH/RPB5)